MKRNQFWLLVWGAVASLVISCAPYGHATVEGFDLLRYAGSMPAQTLVSKYPVESKNLTIDLIFYHWACSRYGLDPEIPNMDKVTSSLVAVSADPVVAWAASELGQKEWIAKVAPANSDDERVRSLNDARQALDAAASRSNTYPTRSIESLTSCVTLLNSLDMKLSLAFVTERRAERQLYAVRRYREARGNYERAYPVFSSYGLRAKVARIFYDLGHLENEMSRYYFAQQNYASSAAEWKALGRGDLAGRQMVNAGIALASDNKITTALSTMRSGLELCRMYADAKKSYGTLTQLLLDVAPYYASVNDAETQKLLLDEAEKTARDSGDPILLATVLKEQANLWQSTGVTPRVRERMTEREKVLSAVIQKGTEASVKLADLSLQPNEQGSLLAVAEKGASACILLGRNQQGVDILKRVIAVYQDLGQDDDRVDALRNLAICLEGLGNRPEALNARIQAASIAKSMDKYVLAVEILRDIEQSALDAKDSGTALEALREAVQVMDAAENTLALADVLESRGLLLERIGQPSDAISDLKKASSIYTAEFGEPWTPSRALAKLADLQLQSGKNTDAIASLSSAVDRIERWAEEEGVDPDAETGHSDTLYNLYMTLIGLQIHDGRTDDAIDRLDKAKGYGWSDRLRSLLASSGDPGIASALKATEGPAVTPHPHPSEGKVRKVASSWQSVLNQVQQFSRIAREVRTSAVNISIDAGEIYKYRENLPQGTAVIEYAVYDSSVYVLVATKQSATCWELPVGRDKIQTLIRSLREGLRECEGKMSSGISIAPVKTWSDPSLLPVVGPLSELGELLFEPIRKELAQTKALAFVVPDELGGIPFHALCKDKKGSFQFLVQDYAITYIAPGMFNDVVEPHHGSLNPRTCRVGVFYDSTGALPGAIREKNLIKSIYTGCTTYTGSVANAERFVSAASSCNLIHIAAHHRADPNPSKFSIMLAGQQNSQSKVQFADMLRINNPNLQLAVLSSCDTIGSSDAQAFGTAYTAEIFALAGFPSIIGGLWKISDDASVTLMGSFYKSLGTVGKAEALRRAQISMIQSSERRYANPFYWASFALYGDPR